MRLLLLYRDYSVHVERFKNAFAENGYEIDIADIKNFAETTNTTTQYDICIICPIFLIPEKICTELPEHRFYISMAFDVTHELPALSKEDKEDLIKQIVYSNGIICDSMFIRDNIMEVSQYSIPSIILPYGIDLQSFPVLEIPRNNFDATIHIAAIRNWHDVHNQSSILDAIEILDSSGFDLQNIKFHIAGDGPYRKIEERRILEYIAKGIVVDHGKISNKEVMEVIQHCDIYLSSSTTDGASVSLLEAMFAGCLPVVSNIPGNLSWITNGNNGFLFNENIVEQIVTAIGMVTDTRSHERLREIQLYNRLKVQREADWEKNSGDLVSFVVGKLDA